MDHVNKYFNGSIRHFSVVEMRGSTAYWFAQRLPHLKTTSWCSDLCDLIFRATPFCLVDPLATCAYSILSTFICVFVMIDNAVPSVPASMNDENLDEEEEREVGGGGRNYLIVSPTQGRSPSI